MNDSARDLQVLHSEVLGFTIAYQHEEDRFVFQEFEGSQVMLEEDDISDSPWKVMPLDYPRGRGMNLSINCSDVDAIQARLLDIGYELKLEAVNKWYRCGSCFVGERHFLVMDPDGYLLRFMQDLGNRT